MFYNIYIYIYIKMHHPIISISITIMGMDARIETAADADEEQIAHTAMTVS